MASIVKQEYPSVDIKSINVPDFPKNPSDLGVDNRTNPVLEGLDFEVNSLDLVNQRFRSYSFTENQFKEKVIEEYIKLIKPGGWIEFMVFIVDDVRLFIAY